MVLYPRDGFVMDYMSWTILGQNALLEMEVSDETPFQP